MKNGTGSEQKRKGNKRANRANGRPKSAGFARRAAWPLAAALLLAAVPQAYAAPAEANGIDAAAAANALKQADGTQKSRAEAELRQAEWLRDHSHPLESDGKTKTPSRGEFESLKPILGDKHAVALGENFHQIGDYSRIKVELIKYLHEELGYDVIAFESGMGEAAAAWTFRDGLDAKQMMQGSIFPIWHSEETLELFDYIREQAKTDHPLILAGYDMQFSSIYSSQLTAQLLKAADPKAAESFVQNDLQAMTDLYAAAGDGESAPDAKTKAALAAVENKYAPQYNKAAALLKRHEAAVRASVPGQPELYDIALRTLSDRIAFMRMMRMDVKESYEYRDRLMAENAQWLMDEAYPGKKTILWAHNDHLAKKGSAMSLLEGGEWISGFKGMGERLHEKLGDSLYVIGFYANRGTGLSIGTDKPFEFGPMPPGSLEHLLSMSGYGRFFLDLNAPRPESPLAAWVDEPVYAGEDGMTSARIWPMNMRFVPREQYDGLIFADAVAPPIRLGK
ncbi:erythromycin esterase family protein [Saccharibacillus alkalitolerans]|uniref:Erythromycin esterase family protein n=1 Tax=Saccharibacillus alkalitolerans TaxID=2705290 RepID=A0ABX0F9Q6_9BACL|nr:erythromycin esterase family protein [Saccharibacillus alkalitolerans]NGZ76704.1 erythromycin esterase family protein [Saccharibacillus alkalitolerans]